MHSSGDHGDQEPWSFDEDVTDIVRKFIEMDINYSVFIHCFLEIYVERWNANFKIFGVVMIKKINRPIIRNDEFIFGEQILVCPSSRSQMQKEEECIFLEEDWYNFWTDEL